jgi:ATP-binding cassette subfamily B protein
VETTDVQDGREASERGRRDLRPLARLKPYLLRYPAVLAAALLALVVSAVAMLSVPVAVRRIIDTGFAAGAGGDGVFLGLVGLGAVIAVAAAARFYFINWLGERVVADVRRDVFEHLTLLGPAFFERTHSGEVMSRLTADTTQVKAAAGMTISQALRNTIMLFGALLMMFLTSSELSGLVLVAIPLIVLPLVAYGRIVRKRSRAAQDTLAEASAYAAENLSSVRTMQAYAYEAEVNRRYGRAVDAAFDAARSRLTARAGLTAITMFLVVASVVGVLWYGAGAVTAGRMTGGELGQFLLYALFAAGALGELSEVWGEVQQAAGASERLGEILATRPEIVSPAVVTALARPVAGRVEFENVTFRYPTRPDVAALDGISLAVEPGETVAIVGPSGAGKSTIFNLLLRFYDPTGGRVLIDGVAVDSADLAAVRGAIALVPQEVALFADRIEENIRYGNPHASIEAISRAALAAQADGFIRALPEGYRTVLGERGVQLSGGQRQRIAIARAILKDAPILLLDEATSALDAESEAQVQQALEAVMQGRTTLVIAHRLATVRRADRIIVMDKGRIVETGTHHSLQREGGLYARLAALQFREHETLAAQ